MPLTKTRNRMAWDNVININTVKHWFDIKTELSRFS